VLQGGKCCVALSYNRKRKTSGKSSGEHPLLAIRKVRAANAGRWTMGLLPTSSLFRAPARGVPILVPFSGNKFQGRQGGDESERRHAPATTWTTPHP
jgi:hypothetical protein